MGNCRLGVHQTGNSSATSSVLMIVTKRAFVDARRQLHRRRRMWEDSPPADPELASDAYRIQPHRLGYGQSALAWSPTAAAVMADSRAVQS
jgi:hypothetical protein